MGCKPLKATLDGEVSSTCDAPTEMSASRMSSPARSEDAASEHMRREDRMYRAAPKVSAPTHAAEPSAKAARLELEAVSRTGARIIGV